MATARLIRKTKGRKVIGKGRLVRKKRKIPTIKRPRVRKFA